MDDNTLVKLSKEMRNRYAVCLTALRECTSLFESKNYDEAFWGSPADWEEAATAEQYTLADLFYSLEKSPREEDDSSTYDYSRVFASFLDDCYTIRCHAAGEHAQWKKAESFTPYTETVYRTNLNNYTDNFPENARWIIVGEARDAGHEPRKVKATPVYKPRTPCLSGVSLHADLSWRGVEIYLHDSKKQCIISRKLPKWGIGNYLESLTPLFKNPSNTESLKKILAGNRPQQLISDDGLINSCPDDLKMDAYIRRLQHLLPYAPECSVRLTGWFSSALMKETISKLLKSRYQKILFTYPYKSWKYE